MLLFSLDYYKYRFSLYLWYVSRVTISDFFSLATQVGYLRDSSLAQSRSQLLVLGQVLLVWGCGLSVRLDTSFTSSKQFSLSSSSFLFFSVPISASTENACALRLIVHGDRRFSAMVTNREDRLRTRSSPEVHLQQHLILHSLSQNSPLQKLITTGDVTKTLKTKRQSI